MGIRDGMQRVARRGAYSKGYENGLAGELKIKVGQPLPFNDASLMRFYAAGRRDARKMKKRFSSFGTISEAVDTPNFYGLPGQGAGAGPGQDETGSSVTTIDIPLEGVQDCDQEDFAQFLADEMAIEADEASRHDDAGEMYGVAEDELQPGEDAADDPGEMDGVEEMDDEADEDSAEVDEASTDEADQDEADQDEAEGDEADADDAEDDEADDDEADEE